MRLNELKLRVATHDYIVDPGLVAVALLRRTDPRMDPVALPPITRLDARTPGAPAALPHLRP